MTSGNVKWPDESVVVRVLGSMHEVAIVTAWAPVPSGFRRTPERAGETRSVCGIGKQAPAAPEMIVIVTAASGEPSL